MNPNLLPVPPKPSEDLQSVLAEKNKKIDGSLVFKVIGAQNLIIPDAWFQGGKINPKLKINIPGSDIISTPPKPNQINPEWNFRHVTDISTLFVTSEKIMTIEVWDNENLKDHFLGKVDIDFSKCIEKQNEWVIDGSLPLIGDTNLNAKYSPGALGKIYIQLKFLPKSIKDEGSTDPSPGVDWRNSQKLNKLMIKGKFKFRVIGARGLAQIGKCDSVFCKISIPNQQEISSETDKWLNPIWNFSKIIDTSIEKDVKFYVINQV